MVSSNPNLCFIQDNSKSTVQLIFIHTKSIHFNISVTVIQQWDEMQDNFTNQSYVV